MSVIVIVTPRWFLSRPAHQDYVVQDERFFRPADVAVLIGDASKADAKLGWYPTAGFQELIEGTLR
jgi:GDP-D-mannose dehydratase